MRGPSSPRGSPSVRGRGATWDVDIREAYPGGASTISGRAFAPPSRQTPIKRPSGVVDAVRAVDAGRRQHASVGGRPRLLRVEHDPRQVRHGPFHRLGRRDEVRRHSVDHVERADRGAPEPRQVGAAAERRADVGGQHADVGPAADDGDEVDVVIAAIDGFEPVDADRPRRRVEDLAAAGGVVELAAADLHRAERRRRLLRRADLRRHRGRDRLVRHLDRARPRHLAVGIERRGLDPEPEGPLVGLRGLTEEPQQARGPSHADHEQARGHRIERAGVPDLPRAERSADRIDRIVRGHARRLVHEDHALGRAAAHATAGWPSSAARSRSIVTAGPCSLV